MINLIALNVTKKGMKACYIEDGVFNVFVKPFFKSSEVDKPKVKGIDSIDRDILFTIGKLYTDKGLLTLNLKGTELKDN